MFSSTFTEGMQRAARELALSERIQGLLNTIHEESICPDLNTKLEREQHAKVQGCKDNVKSFQTSTTIEKMHQGKKDHEIKLQKEGQKNIDKSEMDSKRITSENMDSEIISGDSQQNSCSEQQSDKLSGVVVQITCKSDKDLCGKDNDKTVKPKNTNHTASCGSKRPLPEVSHTQSSGDGGGGKRQKTECSPTRRSSTSTCPLLFYNVNRRKIKGVNIPK